MVGGVIDPGALFVGEGAFDLGGGADDQDARGDLHARGDERASADHAVGADTRAVEDNGPHADEAVVLDEAAVDDGAVSDGDVVFEGGGVAVVGDVEDGAVLDVCASADADGVDVAAYHCVKPNGGASG